MNDLRLISALYSTSRSLFSDGALSTPCVVFFWNLRKCCAVIGVCQGHSVLGYNWHQHVSFPTSDKVNDHVSMQQPSANLRLGAQLPVRWYLADHFHIYVVSVLLLRATS